MKTPKLETKRRPVGRITFRRVHARTTKRQRVAAAAEHAGELQGDVPNVGVARALLIILGLHVVAIAGIFVHNRYFDGESAAPPAQAKAEESATEGPKIGLQDNPYVVQPTDTYDRIAGKQGVAVDELRLANGNVPLRAGRILRIPPRRIVAVESPELARRRESTNGSAAGTVVTPGEPVLVRPAIRPVSVSAGAGASAESYVVAEGDSVWRIANRFGVPQEELMKANGIDDPRKMRVGMKLRIPSSQ